MRNLWISKNIPAPNDMDYRSSTNWHEATIKICQMYKPDGTYNIKHVYIDKNIEYANGLVKYCLERNLPCSYIQGE